MFTYLIGREKSATDQPLKKISGDYYGKKVVCKQDILPLKPAANYSQASFIYVVYCLFMKSTVIPLGLVSLLMPHLSCRTRCHELFEKVAIGRFFENE